MHLRKPLRPSELFENPRPLELEIGVGKGAFLLEQAIARPQTNFLGLERARRYWLIASDRLRRHGCFNVRIVLADASYFVQEFLPDDVLACVHVYFPDPWPKKRHHKRRLIQGPFVAELARVLAPGGRLQIVTDHREYFEQIEEWVRSQSALAPAEYLPPATAAGGEVVGSNFERKYRREGRRFYGLAAVKSPSSRA